MYHVKELDTAPPGGLDLNIADEEEFSPDKLRANVERLYMTIVGAVSNLPIDADRTSGNRYDGFWKAHRALTVMARSPPNCWVLHCILRCLGLGSYRATVVRHPHHPHRISTSSSDHVSASSNRARQL